MPLPSEVERKVKVKYENAPTDEAKGCHPEKRSVELLLDYGVINLNKPKGPTSHLVSDHVKKILHVEKAGHGGTLDPGVTGVLPIAIGRATRVIQTILKGGKEYVAIMHLHDEVSEDKLRDAVKKFVGEIDQMPPVKSAVVRRVRTRKIYYIDILEIKEQDVLMKVGCEAGTYVRKLCFDIGRKLKVGANMSELVRTKAGPFNDKDWVTLQDLEDSYYFWKEEKNDAEIRRCIKPFEAAVNHLPKIWVHDSAVNPLCHGSSLKVPGIVKLHDFNVKSLVAIMSLKDELIGIGQAEMTSKAILKEEKGIAVNMEKVFMPTGVY